MNLRPASRQEPRRLKTRAALLAAGAELLADRSIDAIPVNDIIDLAGVAKGSFFNHFADKDTFAAAVAAEIRQKVEIDATATNTGISDPAARMARAIGTFVRFALTDGRAARVMLRGHARALQTDHPLNTALRTDIADGCASGRFGCPDQEAAAVYVIGLCQILLSTTVERSLSAPQAARLAADVIALLLTGLGVARPEASTIAAEAGTIVTG